MRCRWASSDPQVLGGGGNTPAEGQLGDGFARSTAGGRVSTATLRGQRPGLLVHGAVLHGEALAHHLVHGAILQGEALAHCLVAEVKTSFFRT